MLEDNVIELVLKDTQLVLVFQRTHKLRVIEKLELCALLIDPHTCRWDRGRSCLVDPPRKRGEERLIKQKASHVLIEIESWCG